MPDGELNSYTSDPVLSLVPTTHINKHMSDIHINNIHSNKHMSDIHINNIHSNKHMSDIHINNIHINNIHESTY